MCIQTKIQSMVYVHNDVTVVGLVLSRMIKQWLVPNYKFIYELANYIGLNLPTVLYLIIDYREIITQR